MVMNWVVVFSFISTVERIVHHFGVGVLVQRVVRRVSTSSCQCAGRNDGARHNGGYDSGSQASNDGTQAGKAVQGLVVASSRTSHRFVGVAEGQRAVVIAWADNSLLEALRVDWRGWVAVCNVANVRQIRALARAVGVVASSTGRVTEVVCAAIVVVTESRWQVLAASLITEIVRASIQVIAINWRVDAN